MCSSRTPSLLRLTSHRSLKPPLKHAVVQDASRLDISTHVLQSQHPGATKVNTAKYINPYTQRIQEAEALQREIEATSGIRYAPAETLVEKDLLSNFQSPTRIASVEREYFIQKQGFLQERHERVLQPRAQSRESLSEFNTCPLPSGGLDSDIQFHAVSPASRPPQCHQTALKKYCYSATRLTP